MPLDPKRRLLLDIKNPFKRNTFLDTHNVFSKNTLMGDWFNARALAEIVDQHRVGIVPGCVEQQQCLKAQSVSHADFSPPEKVKRTSVESEYEERRAQNFRNALNSRKGNISIFDKEEFLRNLTTTSDFFYRLKPQRVILTDELVPRKLVEEDLMQSYGNQTNYGLRDSMRCKANVERRERLWNSTYRDTYRTPRR